MWLVDLPLDLLAQVWSQLPLPARLAAQASSKAAPELLPTVPYSDRMLCRFMGAVTALCRCRSDRATLLQLLREVEAEFPGDALPRSGPRFSSHGLAFRLPLVLAGLDPLFPEANVVVDHLRADAYISLRLERQEPYHCSLCFQSGDYDEESGLIWDVSLLVVGWRPPYRLQHEEMAAEALAYAWHLRRHFDLFGSLRLTDCYPHDMRPLAIDSGIFARVRFTTPTPVNV